MRAQSGACFRVGLTLIRVSKKMKQESCIMGFFNLFNLHRKRLLFFLFTYNFTDIDQDKSTFSDQNQLTLRNIFTRIATFSSNAPDFIYHQRPINALYV